MLPFDFWHRYTFAEYQRRAFYYYRSKSERFKDEWERTRQLAYITAAVQGYKGSANELMPYSWDKQEVRKRAKPITSKEAENILKRYGLN